MLIAANCPMMKFWYGKHVGRVWIEEENGRLEGFEGDVPVTMS